MKFLKELSGFEKVFGNAELDVLMDRMRELVRGSLQQIPGSERQVLLEWVEQVELVRNDSQSSEEQKIERLQALEAGRVVHQFLSSITRLILEKIPNQQKIFLQTGLAGLNLWATAAQAEFAIFGSFAFQKILPRFLLTAQGEMFMKSIRDLFYEGQIEMR